MVSTKTTKMAAIAAILLPLALASEIDPNLRQIVVTGSKELRAKFTRLSTLPEISALPKGVAELSFPVNADGEVGADTDFSVNVQLEPLYPPDVNAPAVKAKQQTEVRCHLSGKLASVIEAGVETVTNNTFVFLDGPQYVDKCGSWLGVTLTCGGAGDLGPGADCTGRWESDHK